MAAGALKGHLRERLPEPAYDRLRRTYHRSLALAGRHPAHGRLLPDFCVIGAAKAGTTSLYTWLGEHPFVAPASRKEIHYFTYCYKHGVDWYRGHFPTQRERTAFASKHGRPFLTGEASPSYLPDLWAPGRVADLLPDVKLLVALRNPVDRAYSQFQMRSREGDEPLTSFAEAVALEETRLRDELARCTVEPLYNSQPLADWSYLRWGRYAEHLERWLELFPRQQFHILTLEELSLDPQRTMERVHEFLELPPHRYGDLGQFELVPGGTVVRSKISYDPLTPALRAQLTEYFRPHNERLYELLGTDFGWETAPPGS